MAPPDGDFRLSPALALSAALIAACQGSAAPSAPVQVAAASDLSLAFAELGRLFEQSTRQKVSFSFAASGALSKQLEQGAPFDVFAAANASFVDSAVRAGACDGATKAAYARGHVVVWSARGGARLQTLTDLTRPEIKHIAIANPDTAPYGKAAREALFSAGLLPALQQKLVHAENVRQALQLAQTGNADAAIVALSLVATDDSGTRLSVAGELHRPIEQTLVLCNNGSNRTGGRAFAELLTSREGRLVLARYGLSSSGEQASE